MNSKNDLKTVLATAQRDRHELAQVLDHTPQTAPGAGVVHRLDRRTQRMFDKTQAGAKRTAGTVDLMIIRVPNLDLRPFPRRLEPFSAMLPDPKFAAVEPCAVVVEAVG